jgi:hypothetical protein
MMRAYCIAEGVVPANPENILGYKETVTARLSKRGVLLDDLSVLRRCDQLWVFTDCPPEPQSVRDLAEGVVVELLYFLKRHPDAPVFFIGVSGLAAGLRPPRSRYDATYEETKGCLDPNQSQVLDVANSSGSVDRELAELVYFVFDPLDAKYMHWLRPKAYDEGELPLVPLLAVEPQDCVTPGERWATAAVCWWRLSELTGRACVLPSLDGARNPSTIATILERLWLQTHAAPTLTRRSWRDFAIPKARVGSRWPLTKYEGGV